MKKILIGLFFILIVSILLFNYISFTPENSYGEKVSSSQNTNFTENNLVNQQFYPNMRYSDSKISYKIENCSLAKKNNFEDAIKIISNKTVLSFYHRSFYHGLNLFISTFNSSQARRQTFSNSLIIVDIPSVCC